MPVRQVGVDPGGPPPFRLDPAARALELLRPSRHEHDRRAGFREPARDLAADAGARAGDERDAPGEIEAGGCGHQSATGGPSANRSPGKYFARRSSAVRACASIPSSREIRAVTGPIA